MTLSKNPQQIKKMFNQIADSYDLNNNFISLGMHKFVKEQSIKLLKINDGAKILDECTGTGDFAEIIKKNFPSAEITGTDFCENMLKIAKEKISTVTFTHADSVNLPFEDETFDIVTMGFGLRNIENYKKALKETYRVLKKGGQFLHLDFGEKNIPSKIFDLLTPPLIRIFYEKNLSYEYLLQSKKEFPAPDELIKIFETNGFRLKYRKDFLFGVISAQILIK